MMPDQIQYHRSGSFVVALCIWSLQMKFANWSHCEWTVLLTKLLHIWKCSPSVNCTTTRCRIPNQIFSYSAVSIYNHSYCNKEVWNILYQSTPHQEAYTLGLLNFAQDKFLLYSWSNSWMQDSILQALREYGSSKLHVCFLFKGDVVLDLYL